MEQENKVKEGASRGKAARTKGFNAERKLAQEFRDLGYPDCVTTRASSRQLDAAKVDLNYIPFNVQSKADKRNFNFNQYYALIEEVNTAISNLPAEMQYRLNFPTLVFHKRDRRTLVCMDKEDFFNIIKQIPKTTK